MSETAQGAAASAIPRPHFDAICAASDHLTLVIKTFVEDFFDETAQEIFDETCAGIQAALFQILIDARHYDDWQRECLDV